MAEGKPVGAEAIALTLLTIAEVPNFYSGLLPSLFTIGHFSDNEDPETLYWIRRGEINALGLSLLLGTAASMLSHSAWPLVGTAAMSAFLMYHYEHALKKGAGNDITERDDA
jgi:hypothetical protein